MVGNAGDPTGTLSPLPANDSPPIVGSPGSCVGSGDVFGTAIETRSPIAQGMPGTGDPGVLGELAAELIETVGAGLAAVAAATPNGTNGPAMATRLSSADPTTVRAR